MQGKLLGWLRYYLQHCHIRVKFQGRKSSVQELENGRPEGDILSPLLFNLLIKQLVSLPFLEDTSLLSYAHYLVLVVIGIRNKQGESSRRSMLSAGSAKS